MCISVHTDVSTIYGPTLDDYPIAEVGFHSARFRLSQIYSNDITEAKAPGSAMFGI